MATKNLSSFILTTFAVVVVIIMVFSWVQFSITKIQPPLIQGVVLTTAKSLKPFYLQSLNDNMFTKEQLQGHWSIISYGYTHCPDICPTTLMTLTSLLELVNDSNQQGQLKTIFYSVDAKRDSSEILKSYVSYFSEDIIGLRALDKPSAKIFEQQLGIQVKLSEKTTSSPYQVAHGISLLLMNPNGALQAVFLPEVSDLGVENFTEQQLFIDFLSVKRYFETKQLSKRPHVLSF
jgi:protein SCO1/2